MSTNYYLSINPQEFEYALGVPCNHGITDDYASLHIGLSAGGWCFQMRIYPEYNINTLEDWKKLIYNPSNSVKIFNEYGDSFTRDGMMSVITERDIYTTNHKYNEEDLRMNNAIIGPNNLLRSKIDGVDCVGHGEGSWDYIARPFC